MRAWFDDKEMELGGPRSARLCESGMGEILHGVFLKKV